MARTEFECNYHDTIKHYEGQDHYFRHNVDIYNIIKFKDKEYLAIYQNALSYRANNYSAPCVTPELSEYGSDSTLLKLYSDDDIDEQTIEYLDDDNIKTVADALALKALLEENEAAAIDLYFDKFGEDETPIFLKDDWDDFDAR